jgi:two-component system, cell cycle response regulator
VLESRRDSFTMRDIPFLMISALDELSSVVRCIEMGAEDYLPKPFDPVLLRARIGACLEKKRLRDMEVEYLRQVEAVTAAAGAVEDRTFQSDSLAEVAERGDALGQLARVFRRMANEVITREDQLRRQIEYLQFEVDEARKAKEVSQITDSEYFRDLQQRASALRSRVRTGSRGRRIDGSPPT